MTSNPNPVDIHVGARLRMRRTLLGMSQTKLGQAVSLTFQQIQKYERGANRIGASRLHQFSRILEVPVSYFFEDMPGERSNEPSTPVMGRKILELARHFQAIEDPAAQEAVYRLVKSLSTHQTRRRKAS